MKTPQVVSARSSEQINALLNVSSGFFETKEIFVNGYPVSMKDFGSAGTGPLDEPNPSFTGEKGLKQCVTGMLTAKSNLHNRTRYQ